MSIFSKRNVAIHCWGGLGSQLYAIALRHELEEQYPNTSFRFKVHNSGVTKRDSELDRYFPESTNVINDFVPSGSQRKINTSKSRERIRRFLVKLALRSRIVVNIDEMGSLARLRPWTAQIRGHYSNRYISNSTLNYIYQLLYSSHDKYNLESNNGYIAIHYRLGDLQNLPNKSPVDATRISLVLKYAKEELDSTIFLYSDSPTMGIKILAERGFIVSNGNCSSPEETILHLVKSQIFIGSNSKLSVWACLFRQLNNPNSINYLPIEIKHHICENAGYGNQVIFY